MILLIDNYDSFTYNLYQYLEELGAHTRVVRNDAIDIEEMDAMQPERLVISPGPSTPEKAGVSVDAVRHFADKIPILGVCLGHQCIAAAYGLPVRQAMEIKHGKTSDILHDGRGVFLGVPQRFSATRYHSLVIPRESMREPLEVSAWTDNGIVMGLRHKSLPLEGVQFHPESILTKEGKRILSNFLHL